MPPQLIFGTATFGMDLTDFQDPPSVRNLIRVLQQLGFHRLDSGARYPPLKPGRAEELLGESKDISVDFMMDTKVFTDTMTDGSGDLTPEAIDESLRASLQRLKRTDGVNVLYAHRADPSTPLEEQIKGLNQQIKQGRCQAVGLENGDYNIITRGVETKILPLVRAHGMTFNAFRPLTAGFLSGKFVNNDHAGTRFADNNPLGKVTQKLFGAEYLQTAMKRFDADVKSYNLTLIEVAIRWIVHHSALGDEDGIIVGASKIEQICETLSVVEKGPLPEDVLKISDDLWEAVKESRAEII
ncbi:MAG: hypothetical protein Q9181_007008 [Wetmoreana brouardii]